MFKNVTWTQVKNGIYYVVCLIAVLRTQIPASAWGILPHSWANYITGLVMVAAWVKSHWNYFIQPDGTSCRVAYFGK